MDKVEHLSRLKSLKIERGNGALFSSEDECMQWIDNVLPLLKYDQNHYADFYNHSKYVRITSLSSGTLMAHLNPMIGIVSQAITELENNIHAPPTNPKHKLAWLVSSIAWLRDNVLAAVIIGLVLAIAGIYITRWLSQPQQESHLQKVEIPPSKI